MATPDTPLTGTTVALSPSTDEPVLAPPSVAISPAKDGEETAWRAWRAIAAMYIAVVALGLAALILFGRVPIGAGWRTDRNLPVREIWWPFTHEVAAVAGGWLSPVLITILVVSILGGCAALVGLAMVVPDEPVAPGAD